MESFLLVFMVAFLATFVSVPHLMRKLVHVGLVGKDMNKVGKPEVPEMGGFAVIFGFVIAIMFFIGLSTFGLAGGAGRLELLLAGLSTVLMMALVGIIDDLFVMRQRVKALLPLFASLPLVAVKAGVTQMNLPFMGLVDFGLLYPLLLIPLGITGASNAMNMLAGFNGLEAGLGLVMCVTIGVLGVYLGNLEAAVIALAMAGALFAFLYYNWYPAKILIGDVGTLSIGAVVASSVIIGNMEMVGGILILPFFVELYLKARSRFQADSWCRILNGKLVCGKKSDIYGLGRLVMYLTGGISERNLVLSLLCMEMVFGLIACWVIF